MEALRRSVDARPLAIFFILAYALSWWTIPFSGGGLLPHGPFVAALIVLALTRGREGIAGLFRQFAIGRRGWGWLLVGPALVLAYLAAAAALNLLTGAALTGTAHLQGFGGTLVMLLLLGGVWEEPGWTGYALPALQRRFDGQPLGRLKASLVLGALRAGWHLPLVLSGAIPWFDMLLFSLAFQFLITWLYNRSQGGLLAVMLLHLTSNVVGGGLALPLFAGLDQERFYVLFVACAWLLALPLAARDRWAMGAAPAPS